MAVSAPSDKHATSTSPVDSHLGVVRKFITEMIAKGRRRRARGGRCRAADIEGGHDRGGSREPASANGGDTGTRDGAPSTLHGGLTPYQIRSVVVAHRGALLACYEIEAQKDRTLRGGVTAVWTIDATGAVTAASMAGSTIHNARVEGCVLRQVRAWRFPSSDGVSQATFPFAFGIGR